MHFTERDDIDLLSPYAPDKSAEFEVDVRVAGEGKGKGEGKGGRSTPLDSPMRSNCPYLRGPFAPQNERFDNPVTCSHCASVGTTANHSGSWECDLHWWTPRSKFNRREIDRWGNPMAGGAAMPGLPQLGPPPPPPQQ